MGDAIWYNSNMRRIKVIDQYITQILFILISFIASKVNCRNEPKISFVSISNKITTKTEDRTSIHFNILSQANVDCKFFSIKIKKFIPGFFYAIRLSLLVSMYDCRILLFDYNYNTRFPNLRFIEKMKTFAPVICFWLETFDESTIHVRIQPTLKIINYHIVTDDPSLRIKEYPNCKEFSEKFHYFPVPIIPERMFYDYNSNEKIHDLCFYGNIENSVHRSERKKILNFLTNNSYIIHGFSAKNRHDLGRPSYGDMLKGIRDSRIGLNFSNHGQIGAVTNRVIEVIASGTVLLSSNEDVLKELIQPGIDYIYFTDEFDLLVKIGDLLKSEVRMREISSAATSSISSRYSAEKFISFLESLIH